MGCILEHSVGMTLGHLVLGHARRLHASRDRARGGRLVDDHAHGPVRWQQNNAIVCAVVNADFTLGELVRQLLAAHRAVEAKRVWIYSRGRAITEHRSLPPNLEGSELDSALMERLGSHRGQILIYGGVRIQGKLNRCLSN